MASTYSGQKWSIVNKTGDYTLTASDYVVTVDTSGGDVTITMPPAATATAGAAYIVKKIAAANTLIIDGDGAETIDLSATLEVTQINDAVELVTDGSGWYIV